MGKEMFESDVEKPLTPSEYQTIMMKYNSPGGRLLQFGFMAIFTFLMWMVVFSISGCFPRTTYVLVNATALNCNSSPVINQAIINPLIEQTEIYVTNILTEDPGNFSMQLETGLIGEDETDSTLDEDGEAKMQSGTTGPLVITNTDKDSFDILVDSLTESDPSFSSSASRYYISKPDELLNYFGALQACIASNMVLVAPNSQEKMDEIEMDLANAGSPNDGFWTSGTNLWTDYREVYFWAATGGPATFTRWIEDQNEPNEPGSKNCIQISKSNDSEDNHYGWITNGCHIRSRFICESI